jgi:hypothetical protein
MGVQVVGGSNPLAPTISINSKLGRCWRFFLLAAKSIHISIPHEKQRVKDQVEHLHKVQVASNGFFTAGFWPEISV